MSEQQLQHTQERYTPVPSDLRKAQLRDRRFFMAMAVTVALIVFAGFAPTFYARGLAATPMPLSSLMVIHGVIFTSWTILFITQVRLIAVRRTAIHRRVGVFGGVLAVAMLVAGFLMLVDSGRRGFSPPGGPPPLVFMAVPFFDLVVFAILVGSALWFRGTADTHKRLMLVATLSLLTPAIARIPLFAAGGIPVFLGLTDLVVLIALGYDWKVRGRIHPAFKWGAALLFVSQPVRILVANTAAWQSFAAWLIS